MSLESQYPNIDEWLSVGWIEVGHIKHEQGFRARAFQAGEMIWEGKGFANWDEAMAALENGIVQWIESNW